MKKKYHVRNWNEYNRALIERGNITFWLDNEVLTHWSAPSQTGQRGRPVKYPDSVIECALTLKVLFNLPFRATEGFLKSLIRLLQLPLDVPDYSLLCKRQKTLSVQVSSLAVRRAEPLHLVVDSTGLKVYGEGEWKVRQHGWMKHRLWRKLHLAVNAKTQVIEALALTELGVQDCEGFSLLLEQLSDPIEEVTGDGAYDRFSCYEEAAQRSFELIVPPQRNAKTSRERRQSQKKASPLAVAARDEAIVQVRKQGRTVWKQTMGYHCRSLAETAMYRLKTRLGRHLKTRTLEHQQVEAAIECKVMNKMTSLGLPQSEAI